VKSKWFGSFSTLAAPFCHKSTGGLSRHHFFGYVYIREDCRQNTRRMSEAADPITGALVTFPRTCEAMVYQFVEETSIAFEARPLRARRSASRFRLSTRAPHVSPLFPGPVSSFTLWAVFARSRRKKTAFVFVPLI